MQLNETVLNKKEFYKIRTNVFEIITLIWIDDFHDHYLDSLEAICTKIKNECFSNSGINRVFSFFTFNIFFARNILLNSLETQ